MKTIDEPTRTEAYRFLATAFAYPGDRVVEALRSQDELAAEPSLREPLARLREVARDLTRDALESEFVRTFGHSIPREYPPFETEFTSAQTFQQTADLGDIGAFYRAFGVRVAGGSAERLDALAVELEFMHLLAVKAAHARARGEAEHLEIVESAARKFLSEHLGRWALAFAKRLAAKGGSPLYAALAGALDAWLRADLAHLGIPVPPQPGEPALLHARDWSQEAESAFADPEAALAAFKKEMRP